MVKFIGKIKDFFKKKFGFKSKEKPVQSQGAEESKPQKEGSATEQQSE